MTARAHRVRQVQLVVEQLDTGGLRFTSPTMAPGWAVVAAGSPYDVARAVAVSFREAEVAAYARWRGRLYDHDDPTARGRPDPAEPPERPRSAASWAARGPARFRPDRPDVHPPDRWQPLPDGGYLSPSGRRYGPDTQCARKVAARRAAANLPLPP